MRNSKTKLLCIKVKRPSYTKSLVAPSTSDLNVQTVFRHFVSFITIQRILDWQNNWKPKRHSDLVTTTSFVKSDVLRLTWFHIAIECLHVEVHYCPNFVVQPFRLSFGGLWDLEIACTFYTIKKQRNEKRNQTVKLCHSGKRVSNSIFRYNGRLSLLLKPLKTYREQLFRTLNTGSCWKFRLQGLMTSKF